MTEAEVVMLSAIATLSPITAMATVPATRASNRAYSAAATPLLSFASLLSKLWSPRLTSLSQIWTGLTIGWMLALTDSVPL